MSFYGTKTDSHPKLYYTTAEIAALLKVKQSTVRYWCEVFGIEPKRNRKHERRFRFDDALKVQYIFFMRYRKRHAIKYIQQSVCVAGWPTPTMLRQWVDEHKQ